MKSGQLDDEVSGRDTFDVCCYYVNYSESPDFIASAVLSQHPERLLWVFVVWVTLRAKVAD